MNWKNSGTNGGTRKMGRGDGIIGPKVLLAALVVLVIATILWFQPWHLGNAFRAIGLPDQAGAAGPVESQLETLKMPGCNQSYTPSAKALECMSRPVVAISPIRDANGCIVDVTC